MIFRPELVRLINEGRKTMTRRPIGGEAVCRYKPGRVYAVQPGRGRPANSHITIQEVRTEPLGSLSLRDARREGFRTTAEFFAYWRDLYAREPDLAMPVWVIAFVRGDHTDEFRLLTRRLGGSGGDYTTVPALSAHGEQESPSAHTLDLYARDAEAGHRAHRETVWREERAKIAKSLAVLKAHPWDRGIAHEIELLERRVAAIDRRLQRAA